MFLEFCLDISRHINTAINDSAFIDDDRKPLGLADGDNGVINFFLQGVDKFFLLILEAFLQLFVELLLIGVAHVLAFFVVLAFSILGSFLHFHLSILDAWDGLDQLVVVYFANGRISCSAGTTRETGTPHSNGESTDDEGPDIRAMSRESGPS